MKVSEMRHLADSKKDQKIGVFNPTTKNFTWKFDSKSYTIPKGKMRKFEHHIAEHLAKHLINQILNDKGMDTGKKENRELWIEKILI